jgi:hypothetical protein
MFRRRKSEVDPLDEVDGDDSASSDPRAHGPWDDTEITIEDDDDSRIDLGSLLITPQDGLDVQLQVDEGSGDVMSVVIAGEEGAVEARAFAAPRNGDIWGTSRQAVAAEVARMGGTATERQGRWGTELVVSVMVDTPEGGRAQQQSVVLGIAGPRWLLRATLFGRPVGAYDDEGDIETALRDIVVRRGTGPVPPGDALPLTMPPNA